MNIIINLYPYFSNKNLKNGGRITDPIALPDMAKPFAKPLYLTKYDVTIKIPGGKESPAPIPTNNP